MDLRPSFSVLSRALGDVWIDHVENAEEGEANLLSTAHWRHAPFFQRVRRQVAQNWHPQLVFAQNDPGARMYGHRDRRTVVRVVLTSDGSLARVYVIQGSGAGFLDDEAVRAIQRGAPFPNPPQGLIDPRTGTAVFSFEFNLTFGAAPLLRFGR